VVSICKSPDLYAFVPLICSSLTDFVLLDRFGTLNTLNTWFRLLTEGRREVRGEKKNFTVSALFSIAVHVLTIFFSVFESKLLSF
jgi:hypothetical protein